MTILKAFQKNTKDGDRLNIFDSVYNPFTEAGKELWTSSYIPYFVWNFIIIPCIFLPIGMWAAVNVCLNMFLAEIIHNLHTYLFIVPNHAGSDVYRFDTRCRSKQENYLRQVLGSVNFHTGSDLNDFMHGWLNYQIEHHIWPDMTPLQYKKVQPEVKKLCKKYGVPYIQESIWSRFFETVNISIGVSSMKMISIKR